MPSPRTQATELRQRRANMITELRTKSDGWGAEWTAEQRAEFDTTTTRIDELRADAERFERLADAEDGLGETGAENRGGRGDSRPNAENRNGARTVEYRGRHLQLTGPTATEEYRDAFSRFLAVGRDGLSGPELRALSAANATQGGFTVTPMEFAVGMIQAKDNEVLMRRIGNVLPPIPQAESLGLLSLDSDVDDAEWTSELKTGSDDDKLRFGRREMHPHPLAKRIKISNKLMRASNQNILGIAQQRLGYKVGVTEEKAFMVGDGAKKPLGVFTLNDDGIGAQYDVSDGNTSNAISFDNLTRVKMSLYKYWQKARWIYHPDAITQLLLVKDGDGQFVWRESVRAGEPDRLLNLPVEMSEYAPNTFAAGRYVGILGDFSYYGIVDALSMELKRLDELYSENNQTGFILRQETDGMPTLGEAFRRVKLGA